jgi:hypothetical protein
VGEDRLADAGAARGGGLEEAAAAIGLRVGSADHDCMAPIEHGQVDGLPAHASERVHKGPGFAMRSRSRS